MRFSCYISKHHGDEIKLPSYYRIGFASIVKEALGNNKILFDHYYQDKKANRVKPFTFAVYLPDPETARENDATSLIVRSPIRFFFSTNDWNVFTAVYNGLLGLRDGYPLWKQTVRIDEFRLEREPQFADGEQSFKILSPVVVRRIVNRKGTGYLTPQDAGYAEGLEHAVQALCGKPVPVGFDLGGLAVVKIPHYARKIPGPDGKLHNPSYGSLIPAVDGVVTVRAPEGVLRTIYDCGLGARRSQGFGMLEATA